MIPSIKGKFYSLQPDEVLKKAENFIRLGKKEIVLIGQETSCYGTDIGYSLAELLTELNKLKERTELK